MKALILAGGKSTRLLPQTKDIPKCLLEIGGKTIIDYQIENLLSNGVKDIVVITGFHAEKLTNHLRSKHPEVNFIFVDNKKYKITGPLYGLWLAKDFMNDGFLYLNSDLFCHPKIIKLVIEHEKPDITAIQKIAWNEEAVNIISDSGGTILEIGKQVDSDSNCGEFIGITKIGKEFAKKLVSVLESFIEQDDRKRYAVDAINQVIKLGGNLHALDVTHLPAIEIDTTDDYQKAKSFSSLL